MGHHRRHTAIKPLYWIKTTMCRKTWRFHRTPSTTTWEAMEEVARLRGRPDEASGWQSDDSGA